MDVALVHDGDQEQVGGDAVPVVHDREPEQVGGGAVVPHRYVIWGLVVNWEGINFDHLSN